MKSSYTNKKGKPVEVVITEHARNRFHQRYQRMHDVRISRETSDSLLLDTFKKAVREETTSKKLSCRNKRHQGTSIYFKGDGFRFVVSGTAVVTVEVAAKGGRHFNHRKGGLNTLINIANNKSHYGRQHYA